MRCLIVGASGMLGHQLVRSFSNKFDTHATVRSTNAKERLGEWLSPEKVHGGISLSNLTKAMAQLQAIIKRTKPDFVVNAAGTVKQRSTSVTTTEMFDVNGSFPHLLNDACAENGIRFIHLSTDCVFDGRKGDYKESDPPTPLDDYGRSKLVGEVSRAPAITLRTSIIGLELAGCQSLVEWALTQTGTAKGYTNAIYTGLTTIELSRVIEMMATTHSNLTGLWHVSSSKISKFNLLSMLTQRLRRTDVHWEPHHNFYCDRSLDSQAFQRQTGYHPQPWDVMIDELAAQIQERHMRREARDASAA